MSEGSTNRVRLKEGSFLNIEVPLPSHEEQRRIAELGLTACRDLSRSDARRLLQWTPIWTSCCSKHLNGVVADAPYRPMSEVAPLVRRPVTEIDPDGSYPELGVRSFGRGTFHKPTIQGSDIDFGSRKAFSNVESGRLGLQQHQGMGRRFRGRVRRWIDSRYRISPVTSRVYPVTGTMTAQFLLWYYLTITRRTSEIGPELPRPVEAPTAIRTLGLKRDSRQS